MSLWKAVVERDERFLKAHIRIYDGHAIFIAKKPTEKMAALHYLERKLPAHVTPHLAAGNLLLGEMVGGPDVHFVDELVPRLSDEKGTSGRFDRRFRMKSLRDAIWTELEDAITKKYRYFSCLACNKWIRIDRDSRRTNTRYCNATCRQADCRRRKKVGADEQAHVRALLPRWVIAPNNRK